MQSRSENLCRLKPGHSAVIFLPGYSKTEARGLRSLRSTTILCSFLLRFGFFIERSAACGMRNMHAKKPAAAAVRRRFCVHVANGSEITKIVPTPLMLSANIVPR